MSAHKSKNVIIGNARLMLGDCMDYMATLPDNDCQLAIVDVPYGIGESGDKESRNRFASNNYSPKVWDDSAPPSEYFTELQRVSKNQIIWGANHFVQNIGLGSPCWIVWDKQTGASDFADCELAYTSFKTAVRKFQFQWSGMLQGDMKAKEQRIHPTQKPIKLYEWLLSNYAKPGDRILDTHLGSGSSAIATNNYGYEFTGIELDPDYYAAAVERIDNAHRQGKLFEATS